MVECCQYRIDGCCIAVVHAAQLGANLRDIILAQSARHIRVMVHDRFQSRVCAVVHVWRGQLDISQRCNAECELVKAVVRLQLTAAEIEWHSPRNTRPDLRHANVRELLRTQERSVMTARAQRSAEEQQSTALLVSRQ